MGYLSRLVEQLSGEGSYSLCERWIWRVFHWIKESVDHTLRFRVLARLGGGIYSSKRGFQATQGSVHVPY